MKWKPILIVALVAALVGVVLLLWRWYKPATEGFQATSTIPKTVGELPLLRNATSSTNANTNSSSYKIFDPTAAYVQVEVDTIEAPKLIEKIVADQKVRFDNYTNVTLSPNWIKNEFWNEKYDENRVTRDSYYWFLGHVAATTGYKSINSKMAKWLFHKWINYQEESILRNSHTDAVFHKCCKEGDNAYFYDDNSLQYFDEYIQYFSTVSLPKYFTNTLDKFQNNPIGAMIQGEYISNKPDDLIACTYHISKRKMGNSGGNCNIGDGKYIDIRPIMNQKIPKIDISEYTSGQKTGKHYENKTGNAYECLDECHTVPGRDGISYVVNKSIDNNNVCVRDIDPVTEWGVKASVDYDTFMAALKDDATRNELDYYAYGTLVLWTTTTKLYDWFGPNFSSYVSFDERYIGTDYAIEHCNPPPLLSTYMGNSPASTILSNPNTWNFKKRLGNDSPPAAQERINSFLQTKGGSTDPAVFMWRNVDVSGNITDKNKEEIVKSVSYSMYFNYRDVFYTERQIRVSSEGDKGLYMSPVYNAKPEYVNRVAGSGLEKTLQLVVDVEAVIHNKTNCAVPVTSEMLSFIPYHARRYMLNWGNLRRDRIERFINANKGNVSTPITPSTTYYTSKAPVFDMFSISTGVTPRTYLEKSEKGEILKKIANLYYISSQGKVIMTKILDVYQIGETIFDVRFQEARRGTSIETTNSISTLTGQYYTLRSYPMSREELNNLEVSFQQKVGDLYAADAKNLEGQASSCGVVARYIKIKNATPGKPIRLSQVIATNNYGDNILQGLLATMPPYGTLKTPAALFAGEEVTDQQYNYKGDALDASQNIIRLNYLNENARIGKVSLLTDGIFKRNTDGSYTGRFEPNFYASLNSTTTATGNVDYLQFDLGSPDDIVAVRTVFPASGSNESYNVHLLDNNGVKITESDRTITTSGGAANYNHGSRTDLNYDQRCFGVTEPIHRYKTARFYAEIAAAQASDPTPRLSNIDFVGFSHDTYDNIAALSFNSMYNCGFDIAIDANIGNINTPVQTDFTLNEVNAAPINCSNADTLKSALLEYMLSQPDDKFLNRDDIKAMHSDKSYDLGTYDYIPSSITMSAQIDRKTCGIAWTELKRAISTNEVVATLNRFGKFEITPDTENWNSKARVYNIDKSEIYKSESSYTTDGNAALATLATPIPFPQPTARKAILANGNGACPSKTCSDLGVITNLVDKFNNLVEGPPIRILRVNKAATPFSNRCDFEAVVADKVAMTATRTSTISMLVDIDTTTCEYMLAKPITFAKGDFITDSTPVLSKIYTYASEFIQSQYKSLIETIRNLSTMASYQLLENRPNITSTITTYRSDVLAAYGALNKLKGCSGTDTTNRCSDPAIMNSFSQFYSKNAPHGERISKIVRAGTASDTECDFTIETADMIIRSRDAIDTNAKTKGLRCTMVKSPIGCSFSLANEPYQIEEVFQINSATSYRNANAKCQDVNARLATYSELANAHRNGANWCTSGWIYGESNKVYYADNNGTCIDGKTTKATVYEVDAAANTEYNPTCFGVKPDNSAGTKTVPFNATSYKMPVSTIGPCKVLDVPPSPEDIRDRSIMPITTSPLASLSSFRIISTTSLAPFLDRPTPISPLDYIDCTSYYAINAITAKGITVTSVANKDATTCIANNTKTVPFKRDTTSGIYVVSTVTDGVSGSIAGTTNNVSAAPMILSPPIGSDADCMKTNLTAATGLASLIKGAKRLNATTCDYRISNRDDIAFGDLFKRIGFYTQGATTSIGVFESANPSDSPYKFGAPSNLAAAIQLFKDKFNTTYYDSTDGAKKRVGAVTAYKYDQQTDTTHFTAKSVDIGVYGDTDIRRYYDNRYFSVTFRKKFTDNTPFIYSIDFLNNQTDTIPTGMTPYNDPTPPDPKIQRPEAALSGRNIYRYIRFNVTGTAASDGTSEIYRLNFYTFDTSKAAQRFTCPTTTNDTLGYCVPINIGANGSVKLTDTTGNILLPTQYFRQSGTQCFAHYTPSQTVSTNLPACDLNINDLEPATRSLYIIDILYATDPCSIGYTFDKTDNKCHYNGYFKDVIGPYCGLEPNNDSQRMRLRSRQSMIVNFGDAIPVDGFTITAGTFNRRPTAVSIEGSMSGDPGTWVNLYNGNITISGHFYTTDVIPLRGGNPLGPSSQLPVSVVISEGFEATPASNGNNMVNPIPAPHPRQNPYYISQYAPTPQPLTRSTMRRQRWLRFRTIETYDPKSKFVAMTTFRFFTIDGQPIEPKHMRFSNHEGSRMNPAEGPDALLSEGAAWVDYNKSPLLIQLLDTLPDTPIGSFRFGIVAGKIGAAPVKWRLEGSYDGRLWSPLQETNKAPGVILGAVSGTYRLKEAI